MTLHYHGTPITPRSVLWTLAGRHFCVSHAEPRDIALCDQIGQSVLLDNGAFSAWKRGHQPDWALYYEWADRWLDRPTTWAVIPDVIDGGSQLQDALLREWPHGVRGAPVWHMDEPITRVLRLADEWPRVCIGSTSEFRVVGSRLWRLRMDELFAEVIRRHGRRLPWLHMLRGMQCVLWSWPFASVDSTDIARNHARGSKTAVQMAARWDAKQTPLLWAETASRQGDWIEAETSSRGAGVRLDPDDDGMDPFASCDGCGV